MLEDNKNKLILAIKDFIQGALLPFTIMDNQRINGA